MNGEPLAMSRTNALYVGISHIPLAAVEQLEIDPDNPSLLSAGSPGGVVNFELLDDFDGSEVKMRYVPEIAGAVAMPPFRVMAVVAAMVDAV